jgi:hypothetical protein
MGLRRDSALTKGRSPWPRHHKTYKKKSSPSRLIKFNLSKGPQSKIIEHPLENFKILYPVRSMLATISPPVEAYQYSEVLAAFLLGPLRASGQLQKWTRRD